MGEHFNLHNPEQEEEEEEAEETLSLRDLPLDNNNINNHGNHSTPRRSSSDLFEFFNNFPVDMCPAEEIILSGKLLPPKDHYSSTAKPITQDNKKMTDFINLKRSKSLSEIQTPRSSSTKAKLKLMRNSGSLDHRKQKEMMERISSTKKPAPKPPRWYYVFMFGMAKIPTHMELTDIKNRQSRQNPSALFPPVIDNNSNNTSTVSRQSYGIGKGSYRLIKLLSCKDHASVAVATTPFAWQG
ncbi:hypothetical protein HS088_TW04G01390 [Tripterygium wilfordii]|uniref:Uncharacterized protein n=1 Tax=Tripterygium wilfordii TaxID=458696 RepID=A0A7J7DSY4_TRIWF|nr:uncharacterized protein LOC119996991 [Tripterygium wilfordii]KAF5749421.1 hypothetical protein HS088_TW04G01390 [Tripterygium wilfordii]